MLNVIAILFVIFGLIGLFTIMVKYFQNSRLFESSSQQGILIEPPIKIDNKRSIINITSKGNQYVILTGPNNDILLETCKDHVHETVAFAPQELDLRIV